MSGVVIAGGGVGGIEAALALRALLTVPITLIAAAPRFVYRPWSVGEPFGRTHPVAVDLEGLGAERGVDLVVAEVEGVEGRAVRTSAGAHAFEHLILALGARQVEVVHGAFTFRGPDNAAALGKRLDALGPGDVVAFVATASAVWALPAYELALLTAGRGISTMLVTGEASPLEAFGPETSADVTRLLADAGVEVVTETVPDHFDGRRLHAPMAGSLSVDEAVALPGLLGRPIPGVPHDAGGFVPVDDLCRVIGLDAVYAVGDMTARRLKQGGLAAQQADVAAAAIAAAYGEPVAVTPYEPVLRAMLLTGDGPRYLRHPPVPEARVAASTEAPWWPAHKIAGRHLGPYLAAHQELVFTP